MAQYRFSAQVIKRSDGRSAVAAAAYRAGERLVDERLEMPFDYRNRGGVEHSEIMLPEGAPARLSERSTLWNEVEQAEKRVDARVSREVQLSLPHELDFEQRQALVRDFVQAAFIDKGMVADVAMHTPDAEGDQRNHHAHVMLTTRRVDGEGFGQKDRAWDKREQLAEWREQWATVQNRHLERVLGPDAPKVSHKSLEEQGIEREATIHLGPTASAIERNGERSDRGDVNREIRADNRTRIETRKGIEADHDQQAAQSPQRPSRVDQLDKEFGEYDAMLRRQVAGWKAEQVAYRPPPTIKPTDIRREIVGPARTVLKEAEANLERTRERTRRIAEKRTSLASFIRDPQRAIWSKIREVHAIDRARREVARAKTGVRVREQWLRSDDGRSYTLRRVDASQRAAAPAKAHVRTLDRKIRRMEKRIGNLETVRERIATVEYCGVKTIATPIKARTPEQLMRHVDRAAVTVLQKMPAQQLQQARQAVRARTLGMSMGFTR